MTLLCTVRDCHLPLVQRERRFVCARNHSFDLARTGYLNLLQPQDRRSANPGDSKEAVAARRRLADRGLLKPIAHAITSFVRGPRPEARGLILDVGCGEGYFTSQFATHGIDISVPAISAAARKYNDCFFVVANADRFLPYANKSFALVASITSRMNPEEFARVLADDGQVLIALPGPDDLIELREAVLGEGMLIDRVERTVATFSSLGVRREPLLSDTKAVASPPHSEMNFTLERHERVRHVAHLDAQAIHDVMTSSYRGLRTKERERLSALAELDVTLSRDLLLFRLGERPSRPQSPDVSSGDDQ